MDQQVPEQEGSGVESTGLPSVDEVLQRVSQVAERPVSEHVGVFERAHEQLRRALDAPPGAALASDNDQGA